ncbi:DUF6231 family protein [Granulosicoccus sp. 3-233]|uniref:DUF6231 family protein n=1 Tax=Granulosicoccus sp. 3-233 TaxID=3417969 RepID=UPI003D351B70
MNRADSSSDNPAAHPTEGLPGQLAQYLLTAEPACLVVVGQPPVTPWWQVQPDEAGPRVRTFETLEQCLDSLPEAAADSNGETAGHCIAVMEFETHPDPAGEHDLAAELGRAVRRFPERLIISVDTKEPDDAAFFAFGFRKLQLDDQGSIRLFEYCLSEYKQVPDWLNARYWANPERFGLTDDQNSYVEDDEDDEEE